MKTEHTGLSGAEYATEAANVRMGRPPDTMWLALSSYQDGLGLVALVGFDGQIMRFARRVVKSGTPHPVSKLVMPDVPLELGLGTAVTYAGLWPDARLREVVHQLTAGGTNGWRGWAREFVKLRRDPDRVDAGHPTEEHTKEFVQLFFQQCQKVTAS